ncbi:MAG: hypothetical protein HOE48_20360 [Candidatus Latescibacteria bacterium]|nr:hypothetical protein [Candidatus Latescibacterota bacterium]MBT4140276.1 hypothetical protein [Candidatus Latescibacterota bacterium]MBT5833077.1 hypothetical protein [Candidatus Latescibacterota bacterium]
MTRIEQTVKVGTDGILNISIPLSAAEADHNVKVIVEPLDNKGSQQESWHQFISETAGSWQGEPLIRPDQTDVERRMDLE